MSGMKISDLDFLRLLPTFMRDDKAIVALSKAMDQLVGNRSKRLKILRIWDQIYNLNEQECDELAWELDVDWYDSVMPLERKHTALKSALQVKRKRGTKWAVEELIKVAFGSGNVIPWFEYNGCPFWFKIATQETLTKEGMAYFLYMIDKVKSVRDRIEMIEVTRRINHTIHAGVEQRSYSKCVIVDHFQELRQTDLEQHFGIASYYDFRHTIKEE